MSDRAWQWMLFAAVVLATAGVVAFAVATDPHRPVREPTVTVHHPAGVPGIPR